MFAVIGALASPAAAGAGDDFAAACRKAGGEAALCDCKGAAAAELLDDGLRQLVMLSMTDPDAFTARARDGGLSAEDSRKWNTYIAESNRVCKPGY